MPREKRMTTVTPNNASSGPSSRRAAAEREQLTVMKRLLYLCAALIAAASVDAKVSASPEDNLEQWMTYYYLEPQPAQIEAALRAVDAKGYFENDNVQAPLSGFFTEVFRANPDKIDGWVKPHLGLPSRHILYSALWMANSKQSKAALERMAKAAVPNEVERLQSLLSSPAPTVESMVIDGPASLDYLWGCFFASGSEKPVLRIIDQMKTVNTKGDVGAMLIGGAAQWSVSANARQHDKVLGIVKVRVKAADPETKAMLEKILSDITAEKTKK